MRTLMKTFAFSLSVLLAISCVGMPESKKAPLWITEPDKVYFDAEYLTAVGYGKDRAAAEAEAVAILGKSIRQRVEVNSESSQTIAVETEKLRRGFASKIQTSALIEEIAGIKIKETWAAKDGTAYALAAIDRSEGGNYYQTKIRDYEAAIIGYIGFTADHPGTFEGLGTLAKAAKLAYKNEDYLDLLSVIKPSSYKNLSLAYQSAQTIEVLMQREAEKITIAVLISSDKQGRIAAAFAGVLKDAGFKTRQLAAAEKTFSESYLLKGDLLIEPVQVVAKSDNRYVRFILNSELMDANTSKVILPWSVNGREAHNSDAEAEQRALRTLESTIKKDFLNELLKIVTPQ